MEWVGVNVIQHSQPQGLEVEMIGHKLKSGVYWQGVLQKRHKACGA